jgi:hypothetical protein
MALEARTAIGAESGSGESFGLVWCGLIAFWLAAAIEQDPPLAFLAIGIRSS